MGFEALSITLQTIILVLGADIGIENLFVDYYLRLVNMRMLSELNRLFWKIHPMDGYLH